MVSEITQITPQSGLPSAMASLDIYPWLDFSNVKIVHDYRDKSILNRFSAVGRLWTIFSLIFGALYGSSLVGVMFGMFFYAIKSTMFSFRYKRDKIPLHIRGTRHSKEIPADERRYEEFG